MTAPNAKLTVPDVLPLVQEFYAIPGNGTGGSLHVVLDDDNTHDSHVESCIRSAEARGDWRGVALGRVLLEMSETQRHRIFVQRVLVSEDAAAAARFDALLASLPAISELRGEEP